MTQLEMVPPSEIESKLSRIWETLQGTNKMRACLFNLVIVTPKGRRHDYMQAMIGRLIQRFPSRILFVTIDEESTDNLLQTGVSAITAQQGENEVACDLISIQLSAKERHKAPFLLLPHLLPDLPIHLLWNFVPNPEDPVLQKLLSVSTHVIFDSENSDQLSTFAQRTQKLHDTWKLPYTDLNWGRIIQWRRILSYPFSDPARLGFLKRISEVHLFYNCLSCQAFKHTFYQGEYLQAWLASRLHWEHPLYVKEENAIAYTGEKPVSVFFHPEEDEAVPSGYMMGVKIIGDGEEVFALHRDTHDKNLIHFEYSTLDHCDVPTQFVLEKHESGGTLDREVFTKRLSPHLKEAIAMLGETQFE